MRRDAEASGSLGSDSTGRVWVLETLQTTNALGRKMAKMLPKGSILLLSGPLGAGKTSLVKGLAEGLGVNETITSPTFALAQHYPQGKPKLIHLDLYRLEDAASAVEIFQQEEEEARAAGAIMAIEWPERMKIELSEAWCIKFQHRKSGRLAQLFPPKNECTSNSVG